MSTICQFKCLFFVLSNVKSVLGNTSHPQIPIIIIIIIFCLSLFAANIFQGVNLLAKICEKKNKGLHFVFWRAPETLYGVFPRAPKWLGPALITLDDFLNNFINNIYTPFISLSNIDTTISNPLATKPSI